MLEFEAVNHGVRTSLNADLAADHPVHDVGIRLLQAALPACGFSLQQDSHAVLRKQFVEYDRALLDDALRRYAMQLVMQAAASGQPILQVCLPPAQGTTTPPPALPRFMAVACWLAQAKLPDAPNTAGQQGGVVDERHKPVTGHVLEPIHYFRLCEELLEVCTIRDGTALFTRLLEHCPLLESLSAEAAKLCVLRSCNALLKRLSKAQDLQMCGRILIFIARIYALTDKSGINLHGAVNKGLALPLDDVAPDTCDSTGEPVDGKLYATFWGLQSVFKSPSSVLQQSVWSKTCADLNSVLEQLDARQVTVKAGPSFAAAAEEEGAGGGTGTTVRYLSSSRLFGLQLRDAAFRRQFLVQVAVLLHHIRKPGKSDKAQPAAKYEGLDTLTARVYAAMSSTQDCGPAFADAVRHVLEHEAEWVDWKNGGCNPFERPPAPPLRAPPAGTAAAGGLAAAAGEGGAPRGPPAKRRRVAGGRGGGGAAASAALLLRQVAVPGDQMAGLRASERKLGDCALLPSFEEYAGSVLDELDPENAIEPEYSRLVQDKVFCWKVVRAMSRAHLEQLDAIKGEKPLPQEAGQAVLNCFPAKKVQFAEYKRRKVEEARAEAAAAAAAAAEAGAGQQAPQGVAEPMDAGAGGAGDAEGAGAAPLNSGDS